MEKEPVGQVGGAEGCQRRKGEKKRERGARGEGQLAVRVNYCELGRLGKKGKGKRTRRGFGAAPQAEAFPIAVTPEVHTSLTDAISLVKGHSTSPRVE